MANLTVLSPVLHLLCMAVYGRRARHLDEHKLEIRIHEGSCHSETLKIVLVVF